MPRLTTKPAPSRSRSRHPAEFQIALPDLSQVSEAVAQLAGSGIEARGAIFTRREVVDFILDLVGYRESEPLLERRLWSLLLETETSCLRRSTGSLRPISLLAVPCPPYPCFDRVGMQRGLALVERELA